MWLSGMSRYWQNTLFSFPNRPIQNSWGAYACH